MIRTLLIRSKLLRSTVYYPCYVNDPDFNLCNSQSLHPKDLKWQHKLFLKFRTYLEDTDFDAYCRVHFCMILAMCAVFVMTEKLLTQNIVSTRLIDFWRTYTLWLVTKWQLNNCSYLLLITSCSKKSEILFYFICLTRN